MPLNYGRLQKWSLNVRSEKGDKCAMCGSEPDGTFLKRIEVHHLEPKCVREDIAYDVRNGIPLCHKCHMNAHGNKQYLSADLFPEEKEKIKKCFDRHGWTYPANPPLQLCCENSIGG